MADYCKQDKETDSALSEDWMGSSVDPPCFGQSKTFLCKCLTKLLSAYRMRFIEKTKIVFYGKTNRKF